MKTTWHEVSLDGVTWMRTSVTEWDKGVAFTTYDYPVVDPGTYPYERDRETGTLRNPWFDALMAHQMKITERHADRMRRLLEIAEMYREIDEPPKVK